MVYAAVGSVGYILRMCGHERDVARASGMSAVLNVALNFLLVPKYGGVGAAAATAVSISCLIIYLALVVKRRLNVNSTIFARSSRNPGEVSGVGGSGDKRG